MSALLIALGALGIIWGGASYVGWLPTVQRRGLVGGTHLDMVVIGAGLSAAGVASYLSNRALELAGIVLILAGAALWMLGPSWLEPGWYKRRFPRR